MCHGRGLDPIGVSQPLPADMDAEASQVQQRCQVKPCSQYLHMPRGP